MDKIDLSERDICSKFITPAILTAGWAQEQFREEVALTAGRVTEGRRKIWQRVNRLVDDFETAYASCTSGPNPAIKEKMRGIRVQLQELMSSDAELAGVAAWCLRVRNSPLLTRLAA